MTGPLVRATDLEFSIGNVRIIGPVDFRLDPGELVALVGPNGAGKSTLLASLAGDHRVRGDLEVAGKPISALNPGELARLRAVLPQNPTISFPFRVHEVVRMGRTPWSSSSDTDESTIVADAMAATDVEHLANRILSSLSGGEQARVALARILAQKTPILMLDEPTAALDIHHQEHTFELLRDRVDHGDAVVAVVHDLELAAAYADRIVLLDHGRVAIDGPPETALDATVLSEVYRHDIEVITHPRLGFPLVVPARRHPSLAATTAAGARPEARHQSGTYCDHTSVGTPDPGPDDQVMFLTTTTGDTQ